MTRYTITFAYADKEYVYDDPFDYQGWDALRNADVQVMHMYTEGNYSCDCNRSDFIGESDETFPAMECGRTITLKSIKDGDRVVWPEPAGYVICPTLIGFCPTCHKPKQTNAPFTYYTLGDKIGVPYTPSFCQCGETI